MAAILPPHAPEFPTKLVVGPPVEPVGLTEAEPTMILGMEPWVVLVGGLVVLISAVLGAMAARRETRNDLETAAE